MSIDRRQLLAGAASLLVFSACSAEAQSGPTLRPEDYGARGDGRSDDTAALQRCLDAAPQGSTVLLRPGAVYRIDPNFRPSYEYFGGLKLRSGVKLSLNGAELKALPSPHPQGGVLLAWRVNDWEIVGPGRITGERDIHTGTGGEAVHGILALASSRWRIGGGVEVTGCWGDGIYVGSIFQERGTLSDGFTIEDVHVWNNRRNGISVVGARNGTIRASHVHDMNGTSPMAGIDLEPDFSEHPNRSIVISDVRIHDVMFGIGIAAANRDIEVTNCDISAINTGIVMGDNAHGIRIVRNRRIASTGGGEEGAAFRNVSDPSTISDVLISDNLIAGGGIYVIETRGPAFTITRNRIRASNRGVRGIARMLGGGTFTDNDVLIEAAAGEANAPFLHFEGVTFGRNNYRSLSAARMHSLTAGGQDQGGDVYASASLTRSPYSHR